MSYPEKDMHPLGEPPESSEQSATPAAPEDKKTRYVNELLGKLHRIIPELPPDQEEKLAALVKEQADILLTKDQEIAALQEISDYDPKFPSLLTIRAFRERFEKYLKNCQREQKTTGSYPSGSVAFIDMDNFKNTNDTLGHPMGDTVLSLVAQLIRTDIRPTDEVSRFGGDEIIILLCDTGQDGAVIAVNRIQENLRADVQTLFPEGTDFIQTLSCGVVQIPSNITSEQFESDVFRSQLFEDLVNAADQAHYKGAKEVGKNKIGVMLSNGRVQTAVVTHGDNGQPTIVTYQNPSSSVTPLSY